MDKRIAEAAHRKWHRHISRNQIKKARGNGGQKADLDVDQGSRRALSCLLIEVENSAIGMMTPLLRRKRKQIGTRCSSSSSSSSSSSRRRRRRRRRRRGSRHGRGSK